MNTILITGGAGFVGRYLRAALREHETLSGSRIVFTHVEDRPAAISPGEAAVRLDLTDAAGVDALLAEHRPDAVIHLAAQASVGAALAAAEQTWRINFLGTLHLANAFSRHSPNTVFLNVSTAEVYGSSFNDGVVTEATPLVPNNAYARSKAAAEAMLHDLMPPEARLIIARPFNHSGPGQDERFVIPSFAAQVAQIEAGLRSPQLVVGNLNAQRTFLDVRDVAQAYAALINSAATLPQRLIVNIGSDRVVPIRWFVDQLQTLARSPFDVVEDPARMRPSEISLAQGSSKRLTELTGWTPKIPLERTVSDILDAFRTEHAR